MSDLTAKIESYFAGAGPWREDLNALRAILLDCHLTEAFKRRSACYTFEKGNVATLWALKERCAVAFFKGVFLKDARGLLVAPGENSRSLRYMAFENLAEIVRKKPVLEEYIREAIEVEKKGLKVAFPKDDLDYPQELTAMLEADPDFKAAFEALTPGRRRGYVLRFSQAKQSKTRHSRIEKALPRILAGKGMHDR